MGARCSRLTLPTGWAPWSTAPRGARGCGPAGRAPTRSSPWAGQQEQSRSRVGSWGALPLRASPGVESWCQGLVWEQGAGEAPVGTEAQQGPAGAGPRERTASCPQAASPPCQRPVPASPSHGIITSASQLHMQAACMASPRHSPALADHEPAPRPGSRGFSSQHLLRDLCPGRARRGDRGCWQEQGLEAAFPGAPAGEGALSSHQGVFSPYRHPS